MMGYKKLKEHFKIDDLVQVSRWTEEIWLGTYMVPDIIKISQNGILTKTHPEKSQFAFRSERFVTLNYSLLEAQVSGELKELIQSQDEFENLIPIYFTGDNRVFLEYCEEFDYPNVTTKGYQMKDGKYFLDKKDAFDKLRYQKKLDIRYCVEHIRDQFVYELKKLLQPFFQLAVRVKNYIISRIFFTVKRSK